MICRFMNYTAASYRQAITITLCLHKRHKKRRGWHVTKASHQILNCDIVILVPAALDS